MSHTSSCLGAVWPGEMTRELNSTLFVILALNGAKSVARGDSSFSEGLSKIQWPTHDGQFEDRVTRGPCRGGDV